MTTEIILTVIGVTVVVLGYTTFNLLRKVEKLEDIIEQYDYHLGELGKQIKISDKRLNEIDIKGTFKSDDEIGWFFEQIKVIQSSISKFKIN